MPTPAPPPQAHQPPPGQQLPGGFQGGMLPGLMPMSLPYGVPIMAMVPIGMVRRLQLHTTGPHETCMALSV